MSDMKMYNILGLFNNLLGNSKATQLNESVDQPTVYEEVEAKGSISEAVRGLENKYAMFKEAKAKPDFLDVDKDGNKKETFKKAVKDKEAKVEEGIEDRIAAAREKAAAAGKTIKDKEPTKSNVRKVAGKSYGGSAQHEPDEFKSRKTAILDKDEVDEGQGPYELYNPKHPKFKANYEKYKAKNPGCKLEDFIAAMKKREHGTVEEAGYSAKAARAGKDIGKPGKNFSKIAKGAAERYGSKAAGERVAGAVLNKLRHGEEMDEGTEPTEKVGNIIKRVLGNSLVWEPGYSKLYKNTRRSKTQRVDDYVMKDIEVNVNFPKGDYSLSANAGDQLAVDLKNELIQAGYPVHSDVQIFSDQIMFQTRTPITVTAEDLDEVITKKTSAGNIIKDFEKSKNPKFAGKSKEQRKKQALGAYYGMHPEKSNVKESKQTIKESRMMEGEYDYEKVGRVLAKDRPGLDTNSSEFREAVYAELKKMGIPAKHAQYMLSYDPDFLGDAATSYGYFCKHQEDQMSESAPMFDDHDAMQELDEIAKLAGLTNEMDDIVPGDSDSPLTQAQSCASCGHEQCECYEMDEDMMAGCGDVGGGMEEDSDPSGYMAMEDELDERETFANAPKAPMSAPKAPAAKPGVSYDKSKLNPMEEEMETEGNEFSGALEKARATGAKEFEVGGKRYTVKEDATITVSATLEDDALNLMRKLAGMAEKEVELEPVPDAEELELEEQHANHNVINRMKRPIENVNTPREDYAAADITTMTGTGLDKKKTEIEFAPPIGDNPLQAKRSHREVKEDTLWKQYEAMLNEITK